VSVVDDLQEIARLIERDRGEPPFVEDQEIDPGLASLSCRHPP
jgi:hypothetical protein